MPPACGRRTPRTGDVRSPGINTTGAPNPPTRGASRGGAVCRSARRRAADPPRRGGDAGAAGQRCGRSAVPARDDELDAQLHPLAPGSRHRRRAADPAAGTAGAVDTQRLGLSGLHRDPDVHRPGLPVAEHPVLCAAVQRSRHQRRWAPLRPERHGVALTGHLDQGRRRWRCSVRPVRCVVPVRHPLQPLADRGERDPDHLGEQRDPGRPQRRRQHLRHVRLLVLRHHQRHRGHHADRGLHRVAGRHPRRPGVRRGLHHAGRRAADAPVGLR